MFLAALISASKYLQDRNYSTHESPGGKEEKGKRRIQKGKRRILRLLPITHASSSPSSSTLRPSCSSPHTETVTPPPTTQLDVPKLPPTPPAASTGTAARREGSARSFRAPEAGTTVSAGEEDNAVPRA